MMNGHSKPEGRRAVIDVEEQIPRSETIALRKKHVGPSCKLFFNKDPLKMVRARGQYMYNESHEEFLDCINNVCHVGHCHPHVVKAGQEQMAILSTNSRFLHDNLVLYAERIATKFPPELKVVFFVNSGSEANDLALRLATACTGSEEVITLDHAYHGHVISLMGISPYKFNKAGTGCPETTHVAPVPDVYRGVHRDDDESLKGADMGEVYANNVADICEKLKTKGKKPSCFIAESLQSCGGQIIYPEGYLKRVYEHVRSAGGLCIADEVQVGFGRVGAPHFWAFETQGVVPDIVTVGKPMGNGHPVAAVITTDAVAEQFLSTKVEYFNTFGGNPVSCAIASAVLDVIEDEKLTEHAKKVGQHLVDRLTKLQEKHKVIGDVRGCGLFVGVDLIEPGKEDPRAPNTRAAEHVLFRMKQEKILLQSDGPYNNVLKLKPPMVFDHDNADRFVDTLDEILDEMKAMDEL